MAERDPLSVALFTYSMQPRGGVAHALSLGEALQRAGHAVRVFAIDRSGARFSREPACAFTVLEIESRKESLFDFVRRRSDALVTALETSSQRFDVYHAHDGMSADALRRLAANGSIGSYVRTVHHLTGYDDPRVEAIERASIENARRLFVVSGMWRADLSTRYGRTAAIVGNGIDRSRFFPANVAPVRDPARPHFLTIGGIEQRKNTIALIEAFALVKRRVPGARLTIAGGASVLDHGAYRHAFDLRVAELDLVIGTDVEIARTVSDAEILTLLRAADAFVFPSVVEGFGLVVLEALACGLPVVVSEIAPFVEYLGADDAIFVSPRAPDSIARGMLAALDAATAQRLRARGRTSPPVIRGKPSPMRMCEGTMPEMHFVVRWPDETVTACYSPSLVVREFLEVGTAYPVPTFAALCREALTIASDRVREKFGFACSLAAAELARIDALAARFSGPADRVVVEQFRV